MDLIKLKNILTEYDFIEFALLFGSYANETAHYLSDIDIAINTDKNIDLLTQGEIIATLESEFEKRVDLVIINELYKNDPRLAYNITNNHKVIFCDKQDDYIEFKTQSLKYYFDTSYMYEMFDNALKERLKNGTFAKTTTS